MSLGHMGALLNPVKRSLYVLLAVPATLAALVDGGRWRRRLTAELLARETRPRRFRGVLCLPLDLVAVVVMAYGWLLVVFNLAYPVRWLVGMGGSLDDSWGGPTLAGAWAFHALVGGVPALLLLPWVLKGVTWVQLRLLGG